MVDGGGLAREVSAAVQPPPELRPEVEVLGMLLQGLTGRTQPDGAAAARAEQQALTEALART
jgi:hypothetical protein